MQISKWFSSLFGLKHPSVKFWYVNIYRNPRSGKLYAGIRYETEKEALEASSGSESKDPNYLGTVKI